MLLSRGVPRPGAHTDLHGPASGNDLRTLGSVTVHTRNPGVGSLSNSLSLARCLALSLSLAHADGLGFVQTECFTLEAYADLVPLFFFMTLEPRAE